MADLNKVMIIGRVSSCARDKQGDVRLVVTTSHNRVTNAGWSKAHVDHQIDVPDANLAGKCVENLKPGRLVYIEGRIGEGGVISATDIHYLKAGGTTAQGDAA